MTLFRAVFYEPGHFHAALTLRTPNPRLAPDIHVYATPGQERQDFVTLVEDWYGDFVVLAGRNNTKLETIASLTQAGLHVLADKPWLTDSRQLPYLVQVTAGPRLAMDLMTGLHSLRTRLMA